MQKNLVLGAVILVVVAGVSFYGGMKYQSSTRPTFTRTAGQGGFMFAGSGSMGAGAGARRGGGFTAGDVISKDATSITVKLADGSTKIVLTAASTTVQKSATGSMSDIAVGTSVLVTGSANQDGSISAQSIQIRPAGMAAPAR